MDNSVEIENREKIKKEAADRIERRKETAEIFTPPILVDKMLNMLPEETWEEQETFCDPACGNGNFLIQILWRKLSIGHSPSKALKTVYGVDIERGNIRECRLKLLKIISLFEDINKDHIRTVFQNIRFLSLERFPKGSIDPGFDWRFEKSQEEETINNWFNSIQQGEVNCIDLFVPEEDLNEIVGQITAKEDIFKN